MIVSVKELTKLYGTFEALRRCSLEVPESSVFGLLGPNGAGKTTLIRCLLGYIKPTSGTATIDGFDCVSESLAVRERTSYLPAETKLFRTMRGIDCMEFFATIHPRGNLQRATEIAKRLQLDASRRVAFMSTGMRQKLAISCVMSCSSRLIILDEPTANLDPNVRQEILSLVKESRAQGTTVIFCSHVLSEIEEICDSVAILRRGEVVESVDLKALKTVHRVRGQWKGDLPAEWPSLFRDKIKNFQSEAGRVEFEIEGDFASHLAWLGQTPLSQMVVESVGLRSLYDRIHNA